MRLGIDDIRPDAHLLARRKRDFRPFLYRRIHPPLELDVDDARVVRSQLAARERQTDGPLRVPEVLHPTRPRVDVVL